MKYLSILVVALLTSACCGAKNTVVAQPEQTMEVPVVTEVPDAVEAPPAPGSLVDETEVEIPLPPKPPKLKDDDVVDDYKPEAFNHSRWNKLLKKYVTESGNVDYKGFKNNPTELSVYIDDLTHNTPTEDWNRGDKLAYWINAYNALTVDLILKNYPLESIKDIKDPWDQRLWQFGDKWYNLNDIEHEILRKMDEPRIHFAIVCASVSCPKLQNEAFTASKLEEQLTNATNEFLADTSKNEISKDEIKLSKIFKWFKKDFEQNGSLIDFLNQYTTVTISESAKKSYKDYNWDLND
ncbi:DUF547 domain-containing protein [Winogradskyella sp. MIT101101]|uniref:DUF547 domain-containing protein n=1 Tax=Winogradskyella sp. MIT101101 TaxID=3098297 RepID=UPI00399958D1